VNAENLIAADQVDVADHLPEEPAAPEIIEQPAAGPQGQEQNGGGIFKKMASKTFRVQP